MKKIIQVLLMATVTFGTVLPIQAQTTNNPKPVTQSQSDYVTHPLKTSIDYVLKNKLMWKFSDGTFKPEQPITQADLIVGLVAVKGLKNGKAVPDIPANHWAKAAYEKANMDGILNGIKVEPGRILTREETAVIIINAWENVRHFYTKKQTISAKQRNVEFLTGNAFVKKAGKFLTGVSTAMYDEVSKNTRAELAFSLSYLKNDFDLVQEGEKIAAQMIKSLKYENGAFKFTVPKVRKEVSAGFNFRKPNGYFLADYSKSGAFSLKGPQSMLIEIGVLDKTSGRKMAYYYYEDFSNGKLAKAW